jgi:hypothetical protein
MFPRFSKARVHFAQRAGCEIIFLMMLTWNDYRYQYFLNKSFPHFIFCIFTLENMFSHIMNKEAFPAFLYLHLFIYKLIHILIIVFLRLFHIINE